jgi:hypothetical protein
MADLGANFEYDYTLADPEHTICVEDEQEEAAKSEMEKEGNNMKEDDKEKVEVGEREQRDIRSFGKT